MFSYKNENWVVKDRTETHVYASRPGKKGRPSKFTLVELTEAGVVLPEVGKAVELPLNGQPETSVSAEPEPQPVEPQPVSEPPVVKFDLF